MADYTTKRIGEMEGAFGGSFKRARAELGVEAFGLQVLDLPANLDAYPEHDHASTGQEEVFVLLSGRAEIDVDGERVKLDPDTIIRVGPEARRKIYTGDEPARILAIGGTPGKAYQPPDVTQLGAPDRLPSQI